MPRPGRGNAGADDELTRLLGNAPTVVCHGPWPYGQAILQKSGLSSRWLSDIGEFVSMSQDDPPRVVLALLSDEYSGRWRGIMGRLSGALYERVEVPTAVIAISGKRLGTAAAQNRVMGALGCPEFP